MFTDSEEEASSVSLQPSKKARTCVASAAKEPSEVTWSAGIGWPAELEQGLRAIGQPPIPKDKVFIVHGGFAGLGSHARACCKFAASGFMK